jgi:hypothetical protein
MAAGADIFLRNDVPLQPGHCGAVDELRTRSSNSFPHELHSYSNMGMASWLRRNNYEVWIE